jgi:accessory gene regulator protein AgrB
VVCSSVRLDLMRRFRAVSQEQCKLISLGFKVTINWVAKGIGARWTQLLSRILISILCILYAISKFSRSLISV